MCKFVNVAYFCIFPLLLVHSHWCTAAVKLCWYKIIRMQWGNMYIRLIRMAVIFESIEYTIINTVHSTQTPTHNASTTKLRRCFWRMFLSVWTWCPLPLFAFAVLLLMQLMVALLQSLHIDAFACLCVYLSVRLFGLPCFVLFLSDPQDTIYSKEQKCSFDLDFSTSIPFRMSVHVGFNTRRSQLIMQ